jgi:hypothetical protein
MNYNRIGKGWRHWAGGVRRACGDDKRNWVVVVYVGGRGGEGAQDGGWLSRGIARVVGA